MRRLLALFALFIFAALPANAAARFWVGGTGTWDASDTTHWAATSGGAGGQSVPGTSDDVTLDASSGGGTVTVNTTVTVISITCGAFTGTLDFAANDNAVTLTGNFSGSGAGVRTINLGDGIWTLSSNSAAWTMTTTTNLTFAANSSTIAFTSTGSGAKQFLGGGLTYNSVSLVAVSGSTFGRFTFTGANTFGTLTIGAGRNVEIPSSVTQTITTLSFAGTSTQPIAIRSTTVGTNGTISVASGTINLAYLMYINSVAFAGGATFTANPGFNFGAGSGITLTPPSFGGGGIIGGG